MGVSKVIVSVFSQLFFESRGCVERKICEERERERACARAHRRQRRRKRANEERNVHLVQQARFVGWDHVFNVDERVWPTVSLKCFQSFVDEITNVLSLLLPVVNAITAVKVLYFENVEYWEDLPVVWHKRFADELARVYQLLQDLQSDADNLVVSRVECRLDWDDELWDDRENLSSAVLQHVLDASTCEKVVWVGCLAQTVEEER